MHEDDNWRFKRMFLFVCLFFVFVLFFCGTTAIIEIISSTMNFWGAIYFLMIMNIFRFCFFFSI